MQRIHEEIQLVVAAAGTINSTPLTTAWVDAKDLHELQGIMFLGNMAAETIDFKIEQATDGSGTGVKDLKAATQLAADASNNDSKQVIISAMSHNLDSNNGFRFVRLRGVTGGATGGPGVLSLFARPSFKPAANAATVIQTAVA